MFYCFQICCRRRQKDFLNSKGHGKLHSLLHGSTKCFKAPFWCFFNVTCRFCALFRKIFFNTVVLAFLRLVILYFCYKVVKISCVKFSLLAGSVPAVLFTHRPVRWNTDGKSVRQRSRIVLNTRAAFYVFVQQYSCCQVKDLISGVSPQPVRSVVIQMTRLSNAASEITISRHHGSANTETSHFIRSSHSVTKNYKHRAHYAFLYISFSMNLFIT